MTISWSTILTLCLLVWGAQCRSRIVKRQAGDGGIVDIPDNPGGEITTSAPIPAATQPPATTAAPNNNNNNNGGIFPGGFGNFPDIGGLFDNFPNAGGNGGGLGTIGGGLGSFPTFPPIGGANNDPFANFPNNGGGGGGGGFPTNNIPFPNFPGNNQPNLPTFAPPGNNNRPNFPTFRPPGGNNNPPNFPTFRPPGGNNNPPNFPTFAPPGNNNPPNFPTFGPPGGNNNSPNFPTFRPPGNLLTFAPPGNNQPFPGFPTTPSTPVIATSTCTAPGPLSADDVDRVAGTPLPQNIIQAIDQQLASNPVLDSYLNFSTTVSGPPVNTLPQDTSDLSCPYEQNRATLFQRYGGNCWILQRKQDPIFFAKCRCQECLLPRGFEQTPSACQPKIMRMAVFAYCENGFDPTTKITRERIAVPVSCQCRHRGAVVTQAPGTGSGSGGSGGGVVVPATTPQPTTTEELPVVVGLAN